MITEGLLEAMASAACAPAPRPVCEMNFDIIQEDLAHAIRHSSRFPPNHPMKADRLMLIERIIMQGADPMKIMELHGETATPIQRALEYGDPQTIQAIRNAMQKFAASRPIMICVDPDATREDQAQKKLPVAIIFPGQGSQYVKMLTDAKDLEPCKVLIEKANEILGYDLLKICLEGPEEKLEETKYCQPAMFLANACALEKLKMTKPEVVERASATAGLSLGELNALVCSGAMTFEEALRVVRVRADAMNEESKKCPQAMLSIAGLDLTVVEGLCAQAALKAGTTKDGRDMICAVANHLFPKGYTCSGDKAAVDILKDLADREGALQARVLKTSGAFHTKLMEPAGIKLFKSLRAKVTEMQFPKMDIYMNVRGAVQRTGTDPRELNYDLSAQVSNPVMWQQCVEGMIKEGITEFYECGPMKQLKAMMKRINQDAWENTTSVAV